MTDFDDLITIENICTACGKKGKPCDKPCKRWYDLLCGILKGEI